MRMEACESGTYLEHGGRSFKLDARDVSRLPKLTPLGRKVYFRRKAMDLRSRHVGDPGAALLLEWTRLLAREWSFAPL